MKLLLFLLATIILPITFAILLGAYLGTKLRPKVLAWQQRQQKKFRAPSHQWRVADSGESDPDEDFAYVLNNLQPCLQPYAELIDRMLQPCVYLRPKPHDEVLPTNTRLWGRPAMPLGEAWPLDRDGQPMDFIGQLDLSELSAALADKSQAELLPRQGLLLLFVAQEHGDLVGDDKAEEWRVIWRPEIYQPVELANPPTKELDVPACRLTLHAGRSLPSLQDEVAKIAAELPDDEAVLEEWHELGVSATSDPMHQCLGYSQSIQYDPRLDLVEAQGKRRNGFDPSRWRLLWQIDSDDDAGLMWFDAGMLYLLIRDDDLAAGRLEQARPVIQCY